LPEVAFSEDVSGVDMLPEYQVPADAFELTDTVDLKLSNISGVGEDCPGTSSWRLARPIESTERFNPSVTV